MQSGTVKYNFGTTGTVPKQVTFPVVFETTPTILLQVKSTMPDKFAATPSSISATGCTINCKNFYGAIDVDVQWVALL